MGDNPPQRIFFGSIENAVAKEEAEPTTAMEGVTRTNVRGETMELSEKTLEEERKFRALMKEREMQRTMREIAVPTQDAVVKQRLIELQEPIILFGEGKPERRERLRKLCAQRGVSPMPEKMRKAQEEAGLIEQTEPIISLGPKELKQLRLQLAKISLENAKNRLAEATPLMEDMDKNWERHSKGFDSMSARLSKYSEVASQVGDARPLQHVAFSPDGSEVATASWSGVVKVWTTKGANLLQTIKAHPERAQHVAWNPHKTSNSALTLASCGADNDIKFWSSDSTTPLRVLKGHTDRVNKIAFHPHLNVLASTSHDKTWTLWDVETGQELMAQGGNSRAVYGVSFHCDGALVATAGLDAIARVWDIRSGNVIWTLRGHAKPVVGLDFAPNGHDIATGSDDRTVRIWDLRKKRTVYIMPAHTALISSVQYQPKYGNFLVTSSFDNTVKLWSSKNWALIKVFGGHQSKVTSVSISPELGKDTDGFGERYCPPIRFASSSFDKTMKIWEYDALADI